MAFDQISTATGLPTQPLILGAGVADGVIQWPHPSDVATGDER